MVLYAETPFMQGDVKRPLLSVGKLTKSGAEVKFGSKGSWIDLQRVAARACAGGRPLDSENQRLDHP